MRTLNLFLFSLTAFVLFSDFYCDDCHLVECDPGILSVQFLSKVDDSNLFENGTYQRDSLRLFAMRDSETSDYTYHLYYWQNDPNLYPDLAFTIDSEASGYIFQFNSQERDTLGITFTLSKGSECCSGLPRLTYGIFRGDTIIPDASGFLILKK